METALWLTCVLLFGAGIACAFAHWPWTAWLAGLGGGYWCAIAMAVTGER